jgi:nucleotide-binding universal stress UspA family protein
MLKYILVAAPGSVADEAVFATALAAAPAAAHLVFLHVRMDITEMAVAMASGGGTAAQSVLDQLDAEARQKEAMVCTAIEAFCHRSGIRLGPAESPAAGPTAELALEVGSESQFVAEYGRFADLLVVGRGHDQQDAALGVLEAALMDTGRPLLIAPAQTQAALTGTALIAWKDTPEAARAVAGAMPLLEAAERVLIVTVNEDGAAYAEASERLVRALRWHNPAVSVRNVVQSGGDAVEALLQTARTEHASLLVMGGYGHSRLRETVFGGFTQRILKAADLPVLMAH